MANNFYFRSDKVIIWSTHILKIIKRETGKLKTIYNFRLFVETVTLIFVYAPDSMIPMGFV